MPSSLAHASMAVLLAPMLGRERYDRPLVLTAAFAAAAPDLDALPWFFGRPAFTWLGGHRAFTHSLFFAAIAGLVIVAILGRGRPPAERWRWTLYVAACVAMHGVLDSFADYGDGIEFFSPLSTRRFASPWKLFYSTDEILSVWLPAFVMYHLWVKQRWARAASP